MYAVLVFQRRRERDDQSDAPSRHPGKRRESSQSEIAARLLSRVQGQDFLAPRVSGAWRPLIALGGRTFKRQYSRHLSCFLLE